MIDILIIIFVAIGFVIGFAGIMNYFINLGDDDADKKL